MFMSTTVYQVSTRSSSFSRRYAASRSHLPLPCHAWLHIQLHEPRCSSVLYYSKLSHQSSARHCSLVSAFFQLQQRLHENIRVIAVSIRLDYETVYSNAEFLWLYSSTSDLPLHSKRRKSPPQNSIRPHPQYLGQDLFSFTRTRNSPHKYLAWLMAL